MVDILHKVGIKSSSRNDAYKALTMLDGLSGWWTTTTQGDSKVGGVIQFRFGAGGIDMKVLELQPGKRVMWQVVDGPQEWISTKVSFDLQAPGLEGAGGIHAPLQHQVGGLSAEPEVAARNREGSPGAERDQAR